MPYFTPDVREFASHGHPYDATARRMSRTHHLGRLGGPTGHLMIAVLGRSYRLAVNHTTSLEYRGVRIDLSHVHPTTRGPMIQEAQAWIEFGQRPPLLSVFADGVDVSEQPELWPARVRDYRGLGRLEWVGEASAAAAVMRRM